MSKQELKNYIRKLELSIELEKLIFELIDEAKEVNDYLLNTIADILNLQAEFFEKEAEVIEELVDQHEQLKQELNLLDEEEKLAKVNAIKENQEKLLTNLTEKLEQLKNSHPVNQDNDNKIEEIKQTLQMQSQ
jgi:hypothetical protein